MLGELWQQGFAKYQPGIRISYFLPTSALAFAALYYDQADLVMGHRPGFYDLLAYERVKSFDPTEITAVTGSFDVGGWENSLTILVNEDNPLKCINMEQLDAVFGAARDGGWAGTNWHSDWARGPEKNIRTWGELGLRLPSRTTSSARAARERVRARRRVRMGAEIRTRRGGLAMEGTP